MESPTVTRMPSRGERHFTVTQATAAFGLTRARRPPTRYEGLARRGAVQRTSDAT